ncbi:GDSL esterase/lipase [Quillaja saponaria]|uniref:GDSL esterase/lipase n=1 Tax=Quillaja saponaria TaxID=32244 RepID=A0AAD7Q255_QUISA|nr:GDSL esterase/lipase [Quillaja saponaria]
MATKTCVLHIFTIISICLPFTKCCTHFYYPAVFNFSDSNSDTGDLVSAGIELINLPYGHTYFGEPSGRYSDGRLVVDFLMDAMDLPFLNPYLGSEGLPSFRKGCNFAVAASTILPATAASVTQFSFGIQVAQFLRFKARALDLIAKGKKFEKYLPTEDYFHKGLYMFDIGQKVLAVAFYSKSLDKIIASIPTILAEFEAGVKKLYDQGGRNFSIHNQVLSDAWRRMLPSLELTHQSFMS